ncbi:hypothetical protein GCM10010402_38710 [Actinomadura luteofluorescens]|uniref:DUF6879 family protein n=1 Tax=Actinomadura luteofluorescens TaxID=46163 RepID=UPI0021649F46|nr:DUF6879 family protein [Actinomadura glauciflava]MCR3740250.1 hypothetical protein [Actinomadura glauciflava]
MLDGLAGAPGKELLGDAYWADFDEHFWRTGEPGFWKLERLQEFQEPTDDSWVAFSEGDWPRAMSLLESRREALTQHYAKLLAHGIETWRIRVVEQPLTDYMRWELRLLLMRDELGGHTRVIDASRVRSHEEDGVLPELITLGDDVVYRLLYDENGLQKGGVRYTGRDLVVRCREFVQELYGKGEGIKEYLARERIVSERK